MKIPKLGIAVAVSLVLLVMSLMVMPVAASPDIYPCEFFGEVEVDGVPVVVGTRISAWVGGCEGTEVAATFTGDGGLAGDRYALDVYLDNEVYEGAVISFKIETLSETLCADQTHTWSWLQSYWVDLTATTPDTDPPTVVGTSPVPGATGVAVTTKVTATFDEDVTAVDLTGITIAGATGVSATLDEATDTITIAHDDFAEETLYTVIIPAGAVEDLATVPNANEEYTWSFTTVAPDTTPPLVESTSPPVDDTGVAIDALVTATFDEDVTAVDLTGITIAGATGVSATLDEATDTITIAHDDFAEETLYTVIIPAGAVEDLATVPNANEEYTWSFTTEAKPAPPEEVEVEEEEEEIVSPKPELGPHVSVGNLRISPAEVSPNQPVTISLSVFNSGDRGGSKTLNLLINGELEQSTRVGIPAHGNKSFSFTVQRASPGVYSVYIEGASGWFTVSGLVAPSAPVEAGLGTGDVIAIVVIAIMLIGGLTFAFLYIRRSA